MNTLLKLILKATSKAEKNFVKRDKMLRESQVVEIRPIINRLIDKINAGSITKQGILDELKYVDSQLDLKTKLRQKFSIIRESRNVLIEIRSLALVGLLSELKEQISIDEKDTVESLIHRLQAAINQKNYAVMEELIFAFYNL